MFYFKIKEICSIILLYLFSVAWLHFDLLFQRYSWFFYHPIIPKIMLAYWPHPYLWQNKIWWIAVWNVPHAIKFWSSVTWYLLCEREIHTIYRPWLSRDDCTSVASYWECALKYLLINLFDIHVRLYRCVKIWMVKIWQIFVNFTKF